MHRDKFLLKDLVEHASNRFVEAGIESSLVDAELLAGHVLGLSRGQVQSEIIRGAEITENQANLLSELYGRRFNRQPLQHITGTAYFRNLELSVGKGVFIPRPETEFVAQLAIERLQFLDSNNPENFNNLVAVDLGTGSGAIALAMATEVPNSKVFAVEISVDAITHSRINFQKYGGENAVLVEGDLVSALAELDGKVSVLVSNPPYIPSAAIPRDLEVKLHDPSLALYGGEDGMKVIHQVSSSAKRLLASGGHLIIEHADSQATQVCELLLAQGWRRVESHQDLTGRDRAVTAIK